MIILSLQLILSQSFQYHFDYNFNINITDHRYVLCKNLMSEVFVKIQISNESEVFHRVRNKQILSCLDSNLAVCNEKYVYMRYLIGIRNFKRVYRIVKDNHFADIQNAINILNILNYLNHTHNNNNPNMNMDSDTIYINTNNTAKNLILSNIYVDVSTIKYIQISTRNDTLVVELDKNNANMNTQNMMYDIGKIDNFLSSISLLMKLVNIN